MSIDICWMPDISNCWALRDSFSAFNSGSSGVGLRTVTSVAGLRWESSIRASPAPVPIDLIMMSESALNIGTGPLYWARSCVFLANSLFIAL